MWLFLGRKKSRPVQSPTGNTAHFSQYQLKIINSLNILLSNFHSGYICPLPRKLSTEPIFSLTIQCWIPWSWWGSTYLFPLMPHQFCSIHCKEIEIQYFRTKLTTICTSSIIPLNEDMKEIVLCPLTVFETIILEQRKIAKEQYQWFMVYY